MPNYDELFLNAQQQLSIGDLQGALATFSICSESKSHKLRCLKNMGDISAQQSDYINSEMYYKRAIQLDKSDCELWYYLGMIMVYIDRSRSDILSVFEKSLKLNPDFAPACYGMGCVYRDMGMKAKAKFCLQNAIKIDKDFIDARINLALLFRDLGEYDAALKEFDCCIEKQPGKVEAIAGKALTLFYKRNVAQAEELIIDLASGHAFNPMIATAYSEICKRGERICDALQYLNETLAKSNYTSIQRCGLHYSAAQLYDNLGDYSDAAKHVVLANKYIFDRFNNATYIQQLPVRKKSATHRILLPYKLKKKLVQTITPVFILGMPRSGSTLVEQVLSRHPEINVGGELKYLFQHTSHALQINNIDDISLLDHSALLNIRQKYMADLKKHAGNKKYVTDKLPGNYEKIGLINAIFPHAKIINTNRNKLDVSVSCYFQDFGTRHRYSSDFKTLACTYQHYEDVISFWRKQSKIKIHDTSYERLILDTRKEISDLLNYLALPWANECLEYQKSSHLAKTASFDQVRQPLYTHSIGRWKNYEEDLVELVDAFGIS